MEKAENDGAQASVFRLERKKEVCDGVEVRKVFIFAGPEHGCHGFRGRYIPGIPAGQDIPGVPTDGGHPAFGIPEADLVADVLEADGIQAVVTAKLDVAEFKADHGRIVSADIQHIGKALFVALVAIGCVILMGQHRAAGGGREDAGIERRSLFQGISVHKHRRFGRGLGTGAETQGRRKKMQYFSHSNIRVSLRYGCSRSRIPHHPDLPAA